MVVSLLLRRPGGQEAFHMKLSGFGSARGRRIFLSLGLATGLAAGATVFAQQAPANPPDPFQFKSEAAFVQWQVKAEKTADFESAWQAIKAKAAAGAKPELKPALEGLKMYKVDGAPQQTAAGNVVVYYFVIDPASQTSSYNPTFLLYEAGLFEKAEADPVFKKLEDSIAGGGAQALKKVQ